MPAFQKMSHSVTVRMTPQQARNIAEAALALRISNGDFMRDAALAKAHEILRPPKTAADYVEEIGEIEYGEFEIGNPKLGKAVWMYDDELEKSIPCCARCGEGPLDPSDIAEGLCARYVCASELRQKLDEEYGS
jgi:hypothetical protein